MDVVRQACVGCRGPVLQLTAANSRIVGLIGCEGYDPGFKVLVNPRVCCEACMS